MYNYVLIMIRIIAYVHCLQNSIPGTKLSVSHELSSLILKWIGKLRIVVTVLLFLVEDPEMKEVKWPFWGSLAGNGCFWLSTFLCGPRALTGNVCAFHSKSLEIPAWGAEVTAGSMFSEHNKERVMLRHRKSFLWKSDGSEQDSEHNSSLKSALR